MPTCTRRLHTKLHTCYSRARPPGLAVRRSGAGCSPLSSAVPTRPLSTRFASRVSPIATTAALRPLLLFSFRPTPGERGAPGPVFRRVILRPWLGISGDSGHPGPEPKHESSRATRLSALSGEEGRECNSLGGRGERERGLSYLFLASLRLQGQRPEPGQGTVQGTPASPRNFCTQRPERFALRGH